MYAEDADKKAVNLLLWYIDVAGLWKAFKCLYTVRNIEKLIGRLIDRAHVFGTKFSEKPKFLIIHDHSSLQF